MKKPIQCNKAKIIPHWKGGWAVPGGSRVTDVETARKIAAIVDFEMMKKVRK